MNTNHNEGQQGQATQQANPAQNRLLRPEMMRGLPDQVSLEDKKKLETMLANLYQQMKEHPPDSQKHQNAKQKVIDFTASINKRLQTLRQSKEGQARHPNQQSQGQSTGNVQSQAVSLPPKAQGTSNKPSDQVLHYVNTFPYNLPTNITPGTPEAQKVLADMRNRLVKALYAMEKSSAEIRALDSITKERTEQGNPLSQEEQKEHAMKKDMFQKQHAEAKRYTEAFRKSQEQLGTTEPTGGQPNLAQQTGASGPPRSAVNVQQTPMPGIQSVNSAIHSAKNQQITAGNVQNVVQPAPQAEQTTPGQATNTTNHMSISQTAVNQNASVKLESNSVQIGLNTAVAPVPHVQTNLSRSQNSSVPQSATSTGAPPHPLTQQAALQAARTYSSGQISTTSVMGSHAHPSIPREASNINTIKMPIPKQLPPRALGPPLPVAMQPSRPTLSGGPYNAGGIATVQPVLQKTPGFDLEGEGERILNKRKLDELVRQVTGGGDGLDNGEAITPEVEDCVLSIADEFIDQVVSAACKCAKARGSKTLEIRDIQLILERNYNIRIPGYASDEVRTVRKFQPAQGWIAKMSAIQAAKVTGGKSDL